MTARRYGSGELYARAAKSGAETWYGRWYVNGKQVHRSIGPKRRPGTREGLTRVQAERELRRKIEADLPTPPRPDDMTVEETGERLLTHLATSIKPTTLETYRSLFKTHLLPPLGDKPLAGVTPEQVEGLVAGMRRDDKAAKTIRNALTLLFQVFGFGQRKGWCKENPCANIDRPKAAASGDIRFLTEDELEALLRAVDPADKPFGATDRAMFLTAAMTGLRQGELLALRWRDVDWSAGKVRVRRSYVRGHMGEPKSRRGIRSVPLADYAAGELDRLFKRSAYTTADELVFAHPDTGDVLDHSALVRRFKKALKAAKVRPVRFHDLRHTFGTRAAAAGVPMRTLQEWMGHRDIKTTLIYADYAPSDQEAAMIEAAFSSLSRSSSYSSSQIEPN